MVMFKKFNLMIWIFCLTSIAGIVQADDKFSQPNIIIFMVDDLGWNHHSVNLPVMENSHKKYNTPNLEKLASQGLSFTSAYAQPNCAPTRAAMVSGQYPSRIHNDVYVVSHLNRGGGKNKDKKFFGPEQSEDVAAEAVTIAEALKKNGYATAHIGKYHVGGHEGEETLPENCGFDINLGGFKQGSQPGCFAKRSKIGNWEFPKLGRGDFDKYANPYTEEYIKSYGFPESLIGTPKHVSDALGDALEETISQLVSDKKPFYLQFHTYAVHGPVRSRPDLKKEASERAGKKAEYAGFIRSIDLNIERMLKALEDPNGDGNTSDSIAAKTLVLFTSDNGGKHADNLPLRGKKGMFTEGGIRVPLIAYWPGVIAPNTVTDYKVHSVDYYPTCLELAGNSWRPSESEHPLDGESFVDILKKPARTRKRGPIYYLFPGYLDYRAQPCVVAIDDVDGKRYKLLYFFESDTWQLYCLSDDIGEKNNIVESKHEIAVKLSKKMVDWLNQSHATWKPKYPLDKESKKPVNPPTPLTTKMMK
jgi:arylsulfatase A-like enzyme